MREAPEKIVHLINMMGAVSIGDFPSPVSHGNERILVWNENTARWHRQNAAQVIWGAPEYPSLIEALISTRDDLMFFDAADWYANDISFKVLAEDNAEAALKWLKEARVDFVTNGSWFAAEDELLLDILGHIISDLSGTSHKALRQEIYKITWDWEVMTREWEGRTERKKKYLLPWLTWTEENTGRSSFSQRSVLSTEEGREAVLRECRDRFDIPEQVTDATGYFLSQIEARHRDIHSLSICPISSMEEGLPSLFKKEEVWPDEFTVFLFDNGNAHPDRETSTSSVTIGIHR